MTSASNRTARSCVPRRHSCRRPLCWPRARSRRVSGPARRTPCRHKPRQIGPPSSRVPGAVTGSLLATRADAGKRPSIPLCAAKGRSALQFLDDLRRHGAGFLDGARFQADGARRGRAAAAVAFANGGQVVRRLGRRPWIRAHRNLGARGRRADRKPCTPNPETDNRNELVIALDVVAGEIEVDTPSSCRARSPMRPIESRWRW